MSLILCISNYEFCYIKLSKGVKIWGLENLSLWQRLNSFSNTLWKVPTSTLSNKVLKLQISSLKYTSNWAEKNRMGENIQFGYFFSILDIFKRFLFVNKAKKEIKVRKKQTTKEGEGVRGGRERDGRQGMEG